MLCILLLGAMFMGGSGSVLCTCRRVVGVLFLPIVESLLRQCWFDRGMCVVSGPLVSRCGIFCLSVSCAVGARVSVGIRDIISAIKFRIGYFR
jgi:hypothetical protein